MGDVKNKRVVVAGDTTVDWHILHDDARKGHPRGWQDEGGAHVVFRFGGAMLLGDLLEHVTDGIDVLPHNLFSEFEAVEADSGLTPSDPRYNHATAVWSLYERIRNSKERVWRIKELQGVRRARLPGGAFAALCPFEEDRREQILAIDAIVVDDAGLCVRDTERFCRQLIRAVDGTGSRDSRPWVVLKTAWPVAQGRLLQDLLDACGDRLLVVTTAEDLRKSGFQISEGISWEATAQDLAWEMTFNPRLHPLRRAACVAVSFGPTGIWLSRAHMRLGAEAHSMAPTLVFDPLNLEGDWEAKRPGMLIGYTSIMTLCFVAHILDKGHATELPKAAAASISCMRALHDEGVGLDEESGQIQFPYKAIRKAYAGQSAYGVSRVPVPVRPYTVPGISTQKTPSRLWSILRDNFGKWDSLLELAENIVIKGPKEAIKSVPVTEFGNLVTADRRETESFRSVCRLIREYVPSSETKPLSLAVFGPPGSGKSFGVTQVATAMAADSIKPLPPFNLSQLSGPPALNQAFHQIRDCGLSGKIPLVFWDEFDCKVNLQPLFWLRHFLAPMQDGEFMEGQVTHSIGKAIFVFAGGMAAHLSELGRDLGRGGADDVQWREVKGPDFLSRLKGFIDIVGINRAETVNGDAMVPDSEYVVRRAIVLRNILERKAPGVLRVDGEAQIDRGLLRAFLTVWAYPNGVRSMEAIVATSKLQGATRYQPSALPPKALLELHVNAREFLGIYNQRVEFSGEELERLAAANYAVYAENKGSSAPGYSQLLDADKNKNKEAVRAWPHMLASLGYTFVAAGKEIPGGQRVESLDDKDIARLAQLEHDRWIIREVANGTVYDKTRDDSGVPRRNPYMVPWNKMTREELREAYPAEVASRLGEGPLDGVFDMNMIRRIPQVLRAAGLELVRIDF